MNKMTLNEHVELAEFIRNTYNKLQTTHIDLSNRYGKTSKISKKIGIVLSKFDSAKSELDDLYHAVATGKDFEQYGHVYYSKK